MADALRLEQGVDRFRLAMQGCVQSAAGVGSVIAKEIRGPEGLLIALAQELS